METPLPALVERPHLPALDGLRGVAILLVVLIHASACTGGLSLAAPTSADRCFFHCAEAGWCGVDLFFVLSGFLITGLLLDAKGRPGYWRNFYGRRSLRIFPLYFAVVVVRLVVLPAVHFPGHKRLVDHPIGTVEAAAYCTYLTNVWLCAVPNSAAHLDAVFGVTWSLAVEEQFYLLWPFLVLRLSRTAMLRLCGAMLVLAPLCRAAVLYSNLPDPWLAAYTLTPCRLDAFAVGAALALAARRAGGLTRWIGPARLVAPLALLGLLAVVWRPGSASHQTPAMAVFGFTLVDLLFGAALVHAVASPGWTARMCGNAAPRFFGKYSYAIYLFHVPLFYWAAPHYHSARLRTFRECLALATGSEVPFFLAYTGCVTAVAVTLALLSWHLWEKWWLGLKKYFRSS